MVGQAPNGVLLASEFQRLADATTRATGIEPDPSMSVKFSGIWTMRGRHGEVLAEVTTDGTILEDSFSVDATVLERVADLRRFGFSARAIMQWFGVDQPRDDVREAMEVCRIAMAIRN